MDWMTLLGTTTGGLIGAEIGVQLYRRARHRLRLIGLVVGVVLVVVAYAYLQGGSNVEPIYLIPSFLVGVVYSFVRDWLLRRVGIKASETVTVRW